MKGSLVNVRPDDLAASVVTQVLDRLPQLDRSTIEDLICGCGLPGGEQGFNLGRIISILTRINAPGTTVTRYCASSLQTTRMAFHAIRAGEGHAFISAGVEAVSRYPRGSADSWPDTRNPRYADAEERTKATIATTDTWHDPRDEGLLPDAYLAMGLTAENVARLDDISRRDMDEFAVRSQNLAEKAAADGFWAREITPVTLPDGTVVDTDDCPRPGSTYEAVAALRPAFLPNGRVTAGNSCPLNDGAAALVVMSDVRARALGLTPLARIVATAVSAISPEIMGIGPVEACRRALAAAGMTIADIDLWEMNEAFAAQVLSCQRRLGIDLDRLNVNGGAIALGHPFGMTGARITTTLINSLRTHDRQIGLETMCVAGGQGMAMVIERLG
jgi:acetyl-CoA C-acetyltransferase